jgi:hypothetical protein
MHNTAWVKLLRHIPASEQSKLMLVTTSGVEITIQGFLRIDPECVALRGRLAGSTEAGRVFFIPYAHIDYFGFQQPVKETEFHELFGNLEPLGAGPAPVLAAPSSPPIRTAPAAPAPPQTPRSPSAIKSTVLEKFRSRSLTNPGTQTRPAPEE